MRMLADLFQQEAEALSLPGLPTTARSGPVSSLASLGTPQEVATLLTRARDRDASSGALQSELKSFTLSEGKLRMNLETKLPVADPDELERQRGVRQLIRRTTAIALLGSVPGAEGKVIPAVITVWGSALVQDYDADLGGPLELSVGSFRWEPSPQ